MTDVTIINTNNIGDTFSMKWKQPSFTTYRNKKFLSKTYRLKIDIGSI